jgi:hypothetical protein
VDSLVYRLGCSQKQAKALLKTLIEEGYLDHVKENGWAERTSLGTSLAMASAQGGYKRSSCERALQGFMDRVAELHGDPRMPCVVQRVVLFGSYLTDVPILGDVDLFLSLSRRYADDRDLQDSLERERGRLATEMGRHIDYFYWPEQETKTFLKARSPILKFQPWFGIDSGKFLAPIPHRDLELPEPNRSL